MLLVCVHVAGRYSYIFIYSFAGLIDRFTIKVVLERIIAVSDKRTRGSNYRIVEQYQGRS